jgi:hypothetical protein
MGRVMRARRTRRRRCALAFYTHKQRVVCIILTAKITAMMMHQLDNVICPARSIQQQHTSLLPQIIPTLNPIKSACLEVMLLKRL